MKTYHWGIIGLGKIAHSFANDLQQVPNAKLHAVASRSQDRAKEFADMYGAEHAFGSYEAMTDCPGLDAVYIATPHVSHHSNTLLCLNAGLPVLCEKPFALNGQEVGEMVRLARKKEVFLMEALWTRFLPAIRKTFDLIETGAIGDPVSVTADFGFRATFDPDSRIFDARLGGGALLDIGIYPILLALLLFGKPARMEAMSIIGPTGVDEETGVLLGFPDGKMAHLQSTILQTTPCIAYIYGTLGKITIHTRWHESKSLTAEYFDGRRSETFEFPDTVKGYRYETEHVQDCLAKGLTESPLIPLRFSELLMETLDAVRTRIGLHYPGE